MEIPELLKSGKEIDRTMVQVKMTLQALNGKSDTRKKKKNQMRDTEGKHNKLQQGRIFFFSYEDRRSESQDERDAEEIREILKFSFKYQTFKYLNTQI